MFVIGLTGGIGSGKSTVANFFAALEIPIIDADQIARELVEPNTPALKKIVNYLGSDLLLVDGSLNRNLLRKLIFQSPIDKKWLETLLHPLIKRKIRRCLQRIDSPYVILVAPLLFEAKFSDLLDRVLVVDTQIELQVARIQVRDSCSAEEVRAIIDNQITREERLAKADDIIHNDGELEDLQKNINLLHKRYLQLAKKH